MWYDIRLVDSWFYHEFYFCWVWSFVFREHQQARLVPGPLLPQSQKRHLVAVLHRLLHQLRRLHHYHHRHRGHHLLRLLVPRLIILLCLHRLIRVEILLKVTRLIILHVFTHFLGLKKVTSDMQTHKNPNLRGTSVVPSKPGSKAAAPTPKPKFGSAPVKKDPVTQLDGKKWMVSYSSYATHMF